MNKNQVVTLKYKGKQECPGMEPVRFWDITTEGHPAYRSTLSIEGLKEWKIL